MRTIVDIPQADIQRLDRIAKAQKLSRAEVVRRAVADYAKKNAKPVDIFGLWRDRPVDGLEYERKLRDEWDREWER